MQTMDALDKLMVIGDRVLIKPRAESNKTASGLYLPIGVNEREKIQYGYIMKVGPGTPIPPPIDEGELWKKEEVKYMSLQVKEGDLAIFLQNNAHEIHYKGVKYYITPQHAILMVEKNDGFV